MLIRALCASPDSCGMLGHVKFDWGWKWSDLEFLLSLPFFSFSEKKERNLRFGDGLRG